MCRVSKIGAGDSTFTRFLRAFLTHCLTQLLARCLFNAVTRLGQSLEKRRAPSCERNATFVPFGYSRVYLWGSRGNWALASHVRIRAQHRPKLSLSTFSSSVEHVWSFENRRSSDSSSFLETRAQIEIKDTDLSKNCDGRSIR